MSSHTKRTEFYLFGHQISHSASPAFHNEIFSALDLSQHRYQLHDTKHPQNEPNSRMLEVDAGWHGVQGVESMIQQGDDFSFAASNKAAHGCSQVLPLLSKASAKGLET
ncbi:BQ2448_5832 [Microbotryum intermedium]|uniref:BQ2448_5832 protein n=1 Tax=Microbotryum intermedium TaxID=269621 RepID=A0A238F7X8_9BASI|nr:BQ2448_5832 [Microbotryum intermedium]